MKRGTNNRIIDTFKFCALFSCGMSLRSLKDLLDITGPIPIRATLSHPILLGKLVRGFVPKSQGGTIFSIDVALKRVYVSWVHAERRDGSGIQAYFADDADKYFTVRKQPNVASYSNAK